MRQLSVIISSRAHRRLLALSMEGEQDDALMGALQKRLRSMSTAAATCSEQPVNKESAAPSLRRRRSSYSFIARHESELSFDTEESITVHSTGWSLGRNASGAVGYFPTAFVDLLDVSSQTTTGTAWYDYESRDQHEISLLIGDQLFDVTVGWSLGEKSKTC